MCAAMAVFIVNDACVKVAAADWPPAQIMVVRGVFAVLIMAGICSRSGDLGRWRELLRPIVAGRCALEGFVAFSYISALAVLPIADVTAILLISPLLITAAGALFLGEPVGWRRWLAVGVGFAGMLLVVRPTGEGFGWAGGVAVISTIGVALRDILTRRIPVGVPSNIVAFGTTIAALLVGLMLTGATPWRPFTTMPFVMSLAAAILVAIGNLAIVIAFRNADVSVISPFRYTIIVWAILIGIVVFGERPSAASWLGIALIVGSGLFTIYRETVLSRRGC
jgi:drug/metabolite transporter (DMT)-like permease